MRSKLKVINSQFTQNAAKEGGSIAVFGGDSLIESCNLTSEAASLEGARIFLYAADVTVKHSHFSGYRSQGARWTGSSIAITESTLRLEAVTINDSYGAEYRSALRVKDNSYLLVKDSVLTGYRIPVAEAIDCSESSRVYLDSVLISYYSVGYFGCVLSNRCNLTIENVTFTHTDYAIFAGESTVNIYNTVIRNDMKRFLGALNSNVTFWAFTIRGTYIGLQESVAEFRHTLFTRQDETCMVKARTKSTIKLKSVYVAGPTDGLVCGWNGGVVPNSAVVQGNVSGRNSLY